MGKSAVVRDMSLETAEEVGRIESSENDASQRGADGMPEHQAEVDEAGGIERKSGAKNFADMTELENEDFVFVY